MFDPQYKLFKLFKDGRNGFFFLIGGLILSKLCFLVGILPTVKWLVAIELLTYLTSFIWGVYLVRRTIK